MIAALLSLAVASAPCPAVAEDSVFWQPQHCGNHRGCAVTAPWPAPRNVPFCRTLTYVEVLRAGRNECAPEAWTGTACVLDAR